MILMNCLFLIFSWFTLFVSGQESGVNTAAVCAPYTGTVCAGYVDYEVYTAGKITIDAIEQTLASLPELNHTLGPVDPYCTDTYFRYACSSAFPKCGENKGQEQEVWAGCASTCNDTINACKTSFTLTGQTSLLPDCSVISPITNSSLQPDESCNYISAKVDKSNAGLNLRAIPAGFVMSECPAPFLPDPDAKAGTNDSTNPTYCRFGCCMPCPAQDLFFNEGWTTHGFLATNIVRFISAVVSFILVVSYLVLPDKRRHPSLLILNFSLAIFLFSMVVFFSIGDTKRLQCADAINPSDQDNNTLCAAQGAILIFASLATVSWCAALIVNLHVHTVWNSNFFTNKYIYLNIFCWGLPTAFMAVCLGMHKVKFEFANLCLVSVDSIFDLFFYPMAAIVCPAFLLHIFTFLYIARVAMRESQESELSQSMSANSMNRNQMAVRKHKHVLTAVKIQWRALLLAIVAIITVLFYWIFYFTQIHRMASLTEDEDTVLDWLACMMNPDNTQDNCTHVVGGHMPPFGLMITAEALVSLIGIWIFLIFFKRSIWREWNDLIYDIRLSIGARGRHEKHGEQFFAL
ncbi:hypothetical protein BDA99DRAFT_512016 [Phascolomyces articulosus]|uniref:G-protein coupled receptors family 2 profile 2 domain-containing protein n=1 Tax=Phascolomyces articulosus TaxID=60185 RepID=A0AAD5K8V5_9FUNG|nr:hypothetical protein BDA99DRAFT_512016 [Phascolomyces articulosus]